MATPQELKDQIAALRAEMNKPNEAGPLGTERLEAAKVKIQQLAKRYAELSLNIKESAKNAALLAANVAKVKAGAFTSALGAAAGGTQRAGGFTSAVGAVAGGAQRAATAVGATAAASTAVGSPVVFERFQLALRDLAGVIGQILAPAVEQFTSIIRTLADVIINLDPAMKELIGNVAGIALAIGGVLFVGSKFIAVIYGIGVAIKAVLAAGGPLTLALMALGAAATAAFSQIDEGSDTWLKRFRNNLVKYFTLGAYDPGKPGSKSSEGAGGRQVSFLTGQDIQKRGIENALKLAGGGTVADQQLTEAQKQTAVLYDILRAQNRRLEFKDGSNKEDIDRRTREQVRRMQEDKT